MKSTLFVWLALTCALPAWAQAPASAPAAPARELVPPVKEPGRILDQVIFDGGAPRVLVFTGTKLQVFWPAGGTWAHAGIPTGKQDIQDTTDGTIRFVDAKKGFVTFFTSEGMNKHLGGIFMTTDGGKNWRKVSDRPTQAVAFLDQMNGVALGNPGVNGPARTMAMTHDGGKTWNFII